jgi:toxin ParE1/3/4
VAHLVYSDEAEDDLASIFWYMAHESSSADIAFRFVERIRTKCTMIAATPLIGRARLELRRGLRSFPYRDYVIFYEVRAEAVRILRVLHARGDIEHLDFGQVT